MRYPYFFGYGSLVNRRTHEYENPMPARVNGWRRAWRHSPVRRVSFLTAVKSPGDFIEGLVAGVPISEWNALDERERAYDRIDATEAVEHEIPHPADVVIYAIPPERHYAPTSDNPILLSYIDVVVQGYLTEFGESGVQHFFETTDGWDAPILDDRDAPIYSRHQKLTRSETMLVNDYLSTLSAIIKKL